VFGAGESPSRLRGFEKISAGTEPGERVHPEVLAIMQEIGIDLSHTKPQKLKEGVAKDVQLLITMRCGDKCPYAPGLRRDGWLLPYPKGQPTDYVRAIRNEVKCRVKELLITERLANPYKRSSIPLM
jgi:arsenate reductase